MQIEVSPADDRQVLEAIKGYAQQLRRKQSPQGAITAAKIELAFSKALEEIEPVSTTTEGEK